MNAALSHPDIAKSGRPATDNNHRGRSVRPGRAYFASFVIYTVFVVYGSLVPLDFRYIPFDQAIEKFRHAPYLALHIARRGDLVANFLLYIPLTFLAMGALTRENRRRCRAIIAAVVAIGTASLAVAIEFTQLYFAPRTVSQNDILAEVTGGLCGIACWFTFGGGLTRWVRGLEGLGPRRLAVRILTAYAICLVLYQLFPFDVTIRLSELSAKWASAKVVIVPFTDTAGLNAYTVVSKTAIMVPIGLLLSLLGRGRGHPIARASLHTCIFACLIEAAQLLLYSRYASSTDLFYGTFGGWLGAVGATLFGPGASRPVLESDLWRRRGGQIKLAATITWLACMTWRKWWPFDFRWPDEGLAARAGRFMMLPFTRQYFSTEFLALAAIVREFTAFMILGMLVARLAPGGGRGRKVICLLLIAIIAVIFEAGQLLVVTRVADLTATAVSILGGAAGIWLAEGFVNVFVRTSEKG